MKEKKVTGQTDPATAMRFHEGHDVRLYSTYRMLDDDKDKRILVYQTCCCSVNSSR